MTANRQFADFSTSSTAARAHLFLELVPNREVLRSFPDAIFGTRRALLFHNKALILTLAGGYPFPDSVETGSFDIEIQSPVYEAGLWEWCKC